MFSFFFSSRRRHTRCLSDWSSDVCSSDLVHIHKRTWEYDEGLRVLCAHRRKGAFELAWLAHAQRLQLHPQRRGHDVELRSEERRVGKECRLRWWAGCVT